MHDFYGDEYYTREHCGDLMQEAVREREIGKIDNFTAGKRLNGKYELRPNGFILEIVEKDTRITVEVR
jgi:hypothetical protein